MSISSECIVAICQTAVTGDKDRNLLTAGAALRAARAQGAHLAVLPEMFNCPYDIRSFKPYAESIPGGKTSIFLSGLARESGMFIVGGSIPEKHGSRLYNSSMVFNPQGKLVAIHRKTHLFDVSLDTVSMKESAVLSPGSGITTFTTPFGIFGLLICYDVRFPEMFRLMAARGVAGVIMPGAFSAETGAAHWDMLLRTRAVDNQIFMVAASPARSPGKGYKAYGHSMVVGPWGNKLAECGITPCVKTATLHKSDLESVRRRLPLLSHRRKDLYTVTNLKHQREHD